jgi:hypothetical protein
VSRFLVLALGGLGFAVMGVAVPGIAMTFRVLAVTGTVMLLVELLGFLPFVAFAGHEGNGGKGKERRENFHRAPSLAARPKMATAKFTATTGKSAAPSPTQA